MPPSVNGVSHIALTVTDTARSKAFYMELLGLNHLADVGEKVLLVNDSLFIALNPPPDRSQALENDQFSEHRVGLDHVSFNVGSHADLEAAMEYFDAKGISHGEIKDLSAAGLPVYVLAFRDPDNIQLEFTAPHA